MKRTLAVLLAVLVALTLAGCGSKSLDNLKPDELLKKARASVSAEHYVSISGKIKESGTNTSIDLHYNGEDSYGTIVLAGATLQIRAVDGTTYFKPDKAFWKQQLAGEQAGLITKLIGGRWIVADPSNSNFAQLIEISQRTFLTKEVLSPSSTVTKGEVTTVDGHKAIPLKVKQGKLYLDDETARPIQVSGAGGGSSGTATFSYDKVKAPKAPPKKDRVDLSKLMSGN